MKKILLYLLFSFAFVQGTFAQKYFFGDSLLNATQPQALSSATVTCGTMTLVISETDLKCKGDFSGTATVVASSPSGNYTYYWYDPAHQTTATATGLAVGNISVEVWDTGGNDCIANISLNEPPSLIINASPAPIPPSCFGFVDGTATANPTGTGTSPYTYSWNTIPVQTAATATGLGGGFHTVTVTDGNGCVATKTINLVPPNPLAAMGNSTTINCAGSCNGTAWVAPSGGTSPYIYSWAPGGKTTSSITGLCIGPYTCTVSDSHSCVATYTTTITSPPALTITITGSNLLCNGAPTGSVIAIVSGGTPAYSYLWAPGGYTTSACTGLGANTYSLTVTDANGCIKTGTISITQPTALSVAPTGTNISCFGQLNGTVNASVGGGTAPYIYAWSPSGCTTSACAGLGTGTYTVNVNDINGCMATGTVTLSQPALLTVTPSETDVSCVGLHDGSVSATVAGGTSPYSFNWSSGCTTSACAGLGVGTYSITVTDMNGCIATSSVTVSSPGALSPNLSSVAELCHGSSNGSVTSFASGGTSPYAYNWSSGCTTSSCSNLAAGTYTLTLIDQHGCSATGTITVAQPPVFTVSILSATPNPLNCNGDNNGTATSSPNGGTPGYTYSWSNGQTTQAITGLSVGTYSLLATDLHGCTTTTSVTFSQPAVLTVSISATNPTCNGVGDGVISLSVGGGTPNYTYSWLPSNQTTSSISGLWAGSDIFTVTDSKGCSNIQTVTLTAPSTLTVNASVVKNVSCSGLHDGSATVNPAGGTSPYTYLWAGGSTSQTVTGLGAGLINVQVTDAHGCSAISGVIINQPFPLGSFISSITPNCSLCNGAATVTTGGGTPTYTYLWTAGGQTNISATGLCTGTYSVTVADANGCTNSVPVTISPVISSSITQSGASVSCPGSCDGSATANPSGGSAPYTYSWNTSPVQTTQSATGICAGTYTVSINDHAGCVLTNTVTFTNPPVLSAAMSSSSASCGLCNGTATVIPSGGTGAYSYSWSGFPVQNTATATGLCSGNYTVTLKDANNCMTTNTVTVGNISVISDGASTTLTACGGNNGAICLSPSGGTPGYTYLWSPGASTSSCVTGLTAGIYTVTISDAGGCSKPFIIPLSNTTGPTVTVTFSVNPTCNASCNGSIAVSVAGVSPPYSYLWNPGNQTTTSISALCAGTYIVKVTDNVLCSTFSSTTLTNPVQMSANPTITNVSCNGGSNGNICLSPSGGNSPYTYKWLPVGQTTSCLSGLTSGTYSVVITDNVGCDDTVAIAVTQPAILTVSISATNVTCNGNGDGTATANVAGGTSPYTYAWSNGSFLPSIVGLSASPPTYSITITDSHGCIATASVVITQPAILTTTISSTNDLCNLICDGTATITASGGSTPYSYSWNTSPAQITAIITGLCAGNYDGTVTDVHGCISTQSVVITQPTALTVTVSSTNASCFGGCNGTASASPSGGTAPYAYLWTPSGQTTSTATGLCTGSYTLSVSDLHGCTTNTIFAISSPAQLMASITPVPPTCSGGCNGTATSSPQGGISPYNYLWSNGQTTSTATGLCAGTYTLTLSDVNGCSIVQTTIISSPIPISTVPGIAQATCLVCNGSISVVAFGGTSPYFYSWNTTPVQTTNLITGLCAGIYIDTIKDINGCFTVDTISISNTTGPTITLSSTNVTCNNACNGTATVASATGNGPPWNYLWFPGGQTTVTATGLCANPNPAQYIVTVTDGNGCKTLSPINVYQPGPLASNPTITNATCFGLCTGGITLSPSGGNPPYSYNWMPGGQTTSSISLQCAGNYTVDIIDSKGCTLTTTMTIGQNTILTSTVTSTNDSCNALCDGTAEINIFGGTFPYNYSWTGGQTTSAVNSLCAGTFTITVTDAIGCLRIDSAIISQPTVLTSSVSVINPMCNNSCDGSASAFPSGGTSPYSYLWNPGGATTSAITGLCASNYTLTVTDAHHCSSTNTFVLTNPIVLSSTYTVTNSACSNVCNGAINITPSGGTGADTYHWMLGGQTTQNISGLCTGNDSVTITDTHGCSVTYSMTVSATISVIAHAGKDTSFCSGGTVILCNSSTNATSIAWYQIQNPTWTNIGSTNCVNENPFLSTDYALIATNGMCNDTDTIAVTIFPSPSVSAGSNTTILAGGTAQLNGSGSGTFLWSPSTGLSCTTCANPSASPTVSTTYTLVVTDGNGCTSSDSVKVILVPVIIPNDGISPNGDGKNDTWVIPGIDLYPECVVDVYNRWGQLIFSQTGYKNSSGWDGKFKGKDLSVGTYYYTINLNSASSPTPITGPITIMR